MVKTKTNQEQKNTNRIDKEKVERTIDRVIRNDGADNFIYLRMGSLDSVGRICEINELKREFAEGQPFCGGRLPYAGSQYYMCAAVATILNTEPYTKKEIERFVLPYINIPIESPLFSSLIHYEDLFPVHDGFFNEVGPLGISFRQARYYEQHPGEEIKGLKRLFLPQNWINYYSNQKFQDKRFLNGLKLAYDWVQEQDIFNQRDYKNRASIFGFSQLNKILKNQNIPKPPIDEFVLEQVNRIPDSILGGIMDIQKRKERVFYRWDGNEVIRDLKGSTLKDLYGKQLKQLGVKF